MKTFAKLTIATAILAFVFSCSTSETEITPVENTSAEYTKQNRSDLVENTTTYFKAIDDIVVKEMDIELAERLTEELLTEYADVLKQEGGIKEVQNALKILEENNRATNQSKQEDPCQVGFRKCAISVLYDLVQHVIGGGGQSEGIIEAYTGILSCVGDYIDCVFN